MHFNLLYALILITAPPNSLDKVVDKDVCFLSEHLTAACVSLELLDPRETIYYFRHPQMYPVNATSGDLRHVNNRFHDIGQAPRIHESMMFPCKEIIDSALSLNREYWYRLRRWKDDANEDDQMSIEPILSDTKALYLIWDLARDARAEFYYVYIRRRALRDLRNALGDNAFYQGLLPPFVPLQHFREIK